MQKYFWYAADTDKFKVDLLCKELSISPIVAQILVNRGIASPEEAKAFLYANINDVSSPFGIAGMDRVVDLLKTAILEKDKIAVYGDYDVDGISSTYVLSKLLKKAGADVVTYIPSRMEEGYGLNNEALTRLASEGVKTLVTVDCGIAAVDEVEFAHQKGLKCIITDHHTPPEILPRAEVIINPKLSDPTNPSYNLAGVGVAWKTGWALLEKISGQKTAWDEALNLAEIVALGTVADMVPLTGENRIIVKHGLEVLPSTKNLGLQALIKDTGIDGKMDTYKIGFVIGPRLNAVGRMSSAEKALRLLDEENEMQARARAALLSAENSSRQNVEKDILDKAEEILQEQIDPDDNILLLASPSWHEGVVGIVASKILEKRYLPVICMTIKDGEAKGSARSIAGFNIYEAIKACSEYVIRFGGHAMAAGLTLAEENIENFRKAINDYAAKVITPEILLSKKMIDAEITLTDVTPQFMGELKLLEPHGQGNEKPLFILKNINICNKRPIGKNNEHIKFEMQQKGQSLQALGWGMSDKLQPLSSQVDTVVSLQENHFNGRTTIQAILTDLRLSAAKQTMQNIKQSIVLQRLVKGGKTSWEKISEDADVNLKKFFPDRNILGEVYKLLSRLMKNSKYIVEEQLKVVSQSANIPWESFYLALIIFYELKLITVTEGQDGTRFQMLPKPNQKLQLENSPLYRQIKEEYNLLKEIG